MHVGQACVITVCLLDDRCSLAARLQRVQKFLKAADNAHQGQSRQRGWAAIKRNCKGAPGITIGRALGINGLDIKQSFRSS